MATVAEISYYVIERAGSKKRIKGLNLKTKLQTGDILLLNRNGQLQKFKWEGISSTLSIRDDDLFVCWYGSDGSNRSVKGSRVKELMTPAVKIDYFKFNTSSTANPTQIPLGTTMSHRWSVENARTVNVKATTWNWSSDKHTGSNSVSYMGVANHTYTLDAYGWDGRVLHDEIHCTVFDDRKWEKCINETRPVNVDMFCPLPDYNDKTWNEWPGNCRYFCVYDIKGHRMTNYQGTYSNAYMEIWDDLNVRWYKGKIEKIDKRGDNEVIITCQKQFAWGNPWNSTTRNYDIRITGVW